MALLIKFLPLMLIIALICIIIYTVRDMRRENGRGFSPVSVKRARVCGKRSSINAGDGQPGDLLSMTSYFIAFSLETGEKVELRVPVTVYETIAETDEGALKYQGERYIGFESVKSITPAAADMRKIS